MDLTARQAVLATVAVLVIAVAAATLPDPVVEGGGGPTPVPEGGAEGGGGLFGADGGDFSFGLGGDVGFQGLCFPFLLSPWFVGGAILTLVVLAIVLYRRTDVIATIGFFGLFLTPTFFIFLLLTDCRSPSPDPDPSASPLPAYNISFLFRSEASSAPVGGGSLPGTSPSFVLVLGALAVVILLVFLRATGDDEAEPEPLEEPLTEPAVALADVGASAGRAADRIEAQSSLENEVFRAWREMTDLLELPAPETTTPREFASRARAAGMDSEHVEELTTLFEEIRYGGFEPTESRERRAVALLREIESTYAGSETDPTDAAEGEPNHSTREEGEDA